MVQYTNNKQFRHKIPKWKIMIEQTNQLTGARFTSRTINKQYPQQNKTSIKDELLAFVKKYNIQIGSYIKVITGLDNFMPIYQYTVLQKYSQNTQQMRKSKSSKPKNIEITYEPIFKYGSQIYLKSNIKNISENNGQNNTLHLRSVHRVRNNLFANNYKFNFFQILYEDKYLTQLSLSDVGFTDYSSNQSIWTIQEMQANQFCIFNVVNCTYLCVQNASNGLIKINANPINNNKIDFKSTKVFGDQCKFYIKEIGMNNNQFIITPLIVNYQRYYKTPQVNPNFNDQNQRVLSYNSNLKVRIVPVQNSVISLFYELRFAQEMLNNCPTLSMINLLINELIYFSIPQFGECQGLLSVPMQKLLSQMGISKKIMDYMVKILNQQGFSQQLTCTIEEYIRLLCFKSPQNSLIFSKLITSMLQIYDYKHYISSIISLIHNNYHLITKFQSHGWAQSILYKLELTYSTKDFQTFHNLLKLAGQFCLGSYSIANKYLVMHHLEQIDNFSQKSNKNNQDEQKLKIWTRFFHEGQYVFVQIQNQNKLDEIELQTFLNSDQSNKMKYMGQIYLISAICSGFNINAINRYYLILKAVSAYCYNENFPYFTSLDCKQATLQAISICFDWNDRHTKLQNKYNIGVIFSDQSQKYGGKGNTNARQRSPTSKFNKNQIYNRGLRSSVYYRSGETLTDVLRLLVKSFQDLARQLLTESDRKRVSIPELIFVKNMDQKDYGNLKYWVKIIEIAINARLITMLKKKAGPYTQYFKKIFSTVNKSREKDRILTPSKNPNKIKSMQIKNISNYDNQFQTQINIILQVIIKIIKYNPLYEAYLQQLSIQKESTKNTQNKLMQKFLNVARTVNPFKSLNTQQVKEQKQKYNKLIYMEEMLGVDSVERKQYKYVTEMKFHCFRVLASIYQNVVEEQIEYEIENFGYMIQSSNKFNNKLVLEEGLRKISFVDQNFRLSVLQNWYMQSNPQVLDEITTVLRYTYEQQQIYIRCLNTTFVIFTKQLMSFYEQIKQPLSQTLKLTSCIHTWFQPQILKALPAYYDNITMFNKCLQTVNNQIKKLNLSNVLVLVDYQQVLQNLGILDISRNLITHVAKFQKRAMKNYKRDKGKQEQRKQIQGEIVHIIGEMVKILEFYVHLSQSNKKKIIITLGQVLASSIHTFPFLIYILKQPQNMQNYYNLLSKSIVNNIIEMLPHSKQFLQIVLILNDVEFIKFVEELSIYLDKQQKNDNFLCLTILADVYCTKLLCQVAYRALIINNCCTSYLKWFYDVFIRIFLDKEVPSNVHHILKTTKIIEKLTQQVIQLNSSIAYLIHSLYYDQSMIANSQKRSKRAKQANVILSQQQIGNVTKMRTLQGQKLINNYILTQLFTKITETKVQLVKKYIQYYILDLLPLLKICEDLHKTQDLKYKIYNNTKEYLQKYQQILQQKIQSNKSIKSQDTYQINGQLMNKDKKLSELQKLLDTGRYPLNFNPSRYHISLPVRPQTERKGKRISPDKQKGQQFDKLSKKAMKTWFKSRLTLNQNRQIYINRQKWLQDLQKLQYQYENIEAKRDIVINGSDILGKVISIIIHRNYVPISPENEIFLLKSTLLWLKKLDEDKKRLNKKKYNSRSSFLRSNQKQQNKFLIKSFATSFVLVSLLEQLEMSLNTSHDSKNIIAICYKLKIACFLAEMCPQSMQPNTKAKIEQKIILILGKLSQYYFLHEELILQYHSSKILQLWQVMNSWIPIKLLSELTIIMQQMHSFENYNEICEAFIKARIEITKKKADSRQVGILEVLTLLKQQNQEEFKRIEDRLAIKSEYHEILNILG